MPPLESLLLLLRCPSHPSSFIHAFSFPSCSTFLASFFYHYLNFHVVSGVKLPSCFTSKHSFSAFICSVPLHFNSFFYKCFRLRRGMPMRRSGKHSKCLMAMATGSLTGRRRRHPFWPHSSLRRELGLMMKHIGEPLTDKEITVSFWSLADVLNHDSS